MRYFPLGPIAFAGILAACTPAQDAKITAALATTPGRLFCAVQTAGGGAVVVALVDAEVSALAPGAGPVAVIATGASKAYVDRECAKAGGIPVVPPADPAAAPVVAVAGS